MSAGYQALTEKEKQTLRLMVRGYDAKSLARHLGLSIHTVNERLRDARRKLQVSSSREAARLLFETEGGDPQKLADKQIGEAGLAVAVGQVGTSGDDDGRKRFAPVGVIAGVSIMSILIGLMALSIFSGSANPAAAPTVAASRDEAVVPAVRESEVVDAARGWLALGDEARWKDGWLGTAESFRKANTVERWTDAAVKVRVPLGALVSRTALSQDSVPAPPSGVEVVKFRTSFANRADVIETVSLIREGGDWKVVGIYVD